MDDTSADIDRPARPRQMAESGGHLFVRHVQIVARDEHNATRRRSGASSDIDGPHRLCHGPRSSTHSTAQECHSTSQLALTIARDRDVIATDMLGASHHRQTLKRLVHWAAMAGAVPRTGV